MIIGIGTDIVQIPRIERILNLYGQRFIDRILSKEEVQKLTSLSKDRYGCFLAKRFAAKEAVSKALGVGIGRNLRFKDISVLNDDLGKPFVWICHPENPNKFEQNFGQIKIHLSISDDYPTSVAFAVITS
ncbi:MAG: holo-ACP synthase [Rickettsia endosymbiont of Culicoides impunctatus]|uniref:holo-ACP synthase n=1 Tax=unclassified Candidatus Tisiphia TaxID=2996318 RepID=UPI001E77014D|nr:holo-ACP synthase [Rickettsia endosymbiont of Platyusa sonomae]MCC8416723.1 holo-ACP synthase [Rickettsia endosymbiont of Gnoriste bilineata]UCM85287.1 MAG: holo-ACP synthase [Rickettsia endosymbiont of Culicoides impunctatus]